MKEKPQRLRNIAGQIVEDSLRGSRANDAIVLFAMVSEQYGFELSDRLGQVLRRLVTKPRWETLSFASEVGR